MGSKLERQCMTDASCAVLAVYQSEYQGLCVVQERRASGDMTQGLSSLT